jgi:hypothetical protein
LHRPLTVNGLLILPGPAVFDHLGPGEIKNEVQLITKVQVAFNQTADSHSRP